MPFRSVKFGLRSALSDYLLSGKSNTQHSQNVTRISATGETTFTPGNGYKYHIFTYPNSSDFVVSNGSITAEVLIVAGCGMCCGMYCVRVCVIVCGLVCEMGCGMSVVFCGMCCGMVCVMICVS